MGRAFALPGGAAPESIGSGTLFGMHSTDNTGFLCPFGNPA